MIRSVLIANRGEIASRIIRTCKKMGIKSIAIFSEADRLAPFVKQADLAVFIGESAPSASYLDQDKIIYVAKKNGADAIHPGYGFLAENADFAQRCKAEEIIFIGPHPEAIEVMGSKSKAKALMQKHNVPIVPGYQGDDQNQDRLIKEANAIGLPVLLKATAGGGGKGMRIVHHENELKNAIQAVKREAKNAFGNDELIIEKYIDSGRHIEFQIFGDQHGNALHILERECSIQRRYQKIMEESPSPVMDESLRNRMGAAAINAAKALKYDNAGTVEFIYDDRSGTFYFLEVNTRLQVEHSVTEAITGLDLVQLQIECAKGMPLSIQQESIKSNGYAIEVRLYAEDPSNNFLPVTGTILRFDYPKVEGLRVETAIENGSEISIFYDPMIAKIIVWDQSRQAAHRKLHYVLSNMVCLGITTNQRFLIHLAEHPDFQKGNYNTHFINDKIQENELWQPNEKNYKLATIATTLYRWHKRDKKRTLLHAMPSGWRNNFNDYQQETYLIDEKEILVKYRFQNESCLVTILEESVHVQLISADSKGVVIEIEGVQHRFIVAQKANNFFIHNEQTGNLHLFAKERFPAKVKEKIKGGYTAPMPSQIVKVLVEQGQKVTSGDSLVVLTSMKMESTITAEEDGIVDAVFVEEGASINAGIMLLKISEH